MTREEAIERLKNMAWLYGSTEREQNIEAIDMAIEALQGGDAEVNETKSPYMQQSRHDDGRIKVTRCKDCKYYNNDYMGKWCGRHQAPVWVKEADFCSWARMKGGTE